MAGTFEWVTALLLLASTGLRAVPAARLLYYTANRGSIQPAFTAERIVSHEYSARIPSIAVLAYP